jgi:hypothetical protein
VEPWLSLGSQIIFSDSGDIICVDLSSPYSTIVHQAAASRAQPSVSRAMLNEVQPEEDGHLPGWFGGELVQVLKS